MLYPFLVEHLHTKKDDSQIIDDTDLLTIQDDEGTCIGSGILYYCKEILACLLTNINTQLGIVNKAQTLVFGVILNP